MRQATKAKTRTGAKAKARAKVRTRPAPTHQRARLRAKGKIPAIPAPPPVAAPAPLAPPAPNTRGSIARVQLQGYPLGPAPDPPTELKHLRPQGRGFTEFWYRHLKRPVNPPRTMDIARVVGVSPATISCYFTGSMRIRRRPSLIAAYRLARALRCSMEELVTGLYPELEASARRKRASS